MALFKGGIPTGMDVDKLLKEFDVRPGTQISYESIEQSLGIKRAESRFRTVTTAWRKRLFRERLIQSVAEGGYFRFLTADEAHDQGRSSLRKIGRATGRLATQVEAVNADELTGERRDAHNLLRREAHSMLEAARKSAKSIAAPKATAAANLRIAKS